MLEKKRVKVNPKDVVVVNANYVAQHPEFKHLYDIRNDTLPDKNFVTSISREGIIHEPLISVFNKVPFFVLGNKRGMAAQALGMEEITVDRIPYDENFIRDLRVAENEQRKSTDIRTKIYNVLAYLRLDTEGSPTGLSWDDTGERFNVTKQTIMSWALLGTKGPEWLLDAVDNEEINVTNAVLILRGCMDKKTKMVDEEKLKLAFAEYKAANPTGRKEGSGGDRKSKEAQNRSKNKPSTKLIEYWLSVVPVSQQGIAVTLRVILGIISASEARQLAGGALDWMTDDVVKVKKEPKAKKPKKEKGVKDSEINASDVHNEELLLESMDEFDKLDEFDE